MRYLNWSNICLLGMVLFVGCDKSILEEQESTTDPWPFGTMYEIFVQSFADSNGDGIGDFNGLTAKLDYLQELGIDGIWLMPIGPSPSYHKYDVTDYYGIHPDYGTMADFKNFVVEAHKRNIRIVMDLVINHSSSEHPWFKDAVSAENSKYRDYYVWANIDSIRDEIAKKEVTLDSDNITQWHQAEGNEEYYYGFFYSGMPDLNYDNPELRKEIIKIGKFWLADVGVDGFRLDAAKHIFPDERAEDSHQWWIEFGDAMRTVKPEVYMVGEVWGNAEVVGPYLKGLPSMFDFDFHHGINRILKNEKDDGFIDNLIATRKVYQQIQPGYLDATFVNNHDQNRVLDNIGGNMAKNEMSVAILLTLPGVPYIYYGDEIGMFGQKPDPNIREPFIWDYNAKASEQTSWMEAINSTDKTVFPLSAQLEDAKSTYSYFKYWIHLRNEHEILRIGELKSLQLPETLLGYERFTEDERWVIIHNLSGTEHPLKLEGLKVKERIFSFDKTLSVENGTLVLPPYSSVILR
jgi:alpha-amylase